MVFATALAEPAPLAGTPPSASRFAPMLSGRRTHHRCCEQHVCVQILCAPTDVINVACV